MDPRQPYEVEVVANTTAASGVDYHFQKGMLFWSDTDTRKVRCCCGVVGDRWRTVDVDGGR